MSSEHIWHIKVKLVGRSFKPGDLLAVKPTIASCLSAIVTPESRGRSLRRALKSILPPVSHLSRALEKSAVENPYTSARARATLTLEGPSKTEM